MPPVHNRLFRYDARDAIPALCALGHLVCLAATIVYFDALPAWGLALAFLVVIFNYCWNMQSISHNFIHNPYFVSAWLNRAFSILQSLVLGVPQTILHHFHLNHHWGDNDAKGPNGTTKDWSSTYRHGKGNAPESFWSYSLIGFFSGSSCGPVSA
jgi:fatty acid desaturase